MCCGHDKSQDIQSWCRPLIIRRVPCEPRGKQVEININSALGPNNRHLITQQALYIYVGYGTCVCLVYVFEPTGTCVLCDWLIKILAPNKDGPFHGFNLSWTHWNKVALKCRTTGLIVWLMETSSSGLMLSCYISCINFQVPSQQRLCRFQSVDLSTLKGKHLDMSWNHFVRHQS